MSACREVTSFLRGAHIVNTGTSPVSGASRSLTFCCLHWSSEGGTRAGTALSTQWASGDLGSGRVGSGASDTHLSLRPLFFLFVRMCTLDGGGVDKHSACCWPPRTVLTERCLASGNMHQEPAIPSLGSCRMFTAPDLCLSRQTPDPAAPSGQGPCVSLGGAPFSCSWHRMWAPPCEAWAMFHVHWQVRRPWVPGVLTAATGALLFEHGECSWEHV